MPNKLINEKSPYLLQHAENPVDWFPWSDEAFDKATIENKPVFLSIGYSTCHWCHVMEHESFEDGKVAEILNNYFVSIKVDREERPDIDSVYMSVCQMLSGSGGWPMTIIMTPDKKPFFAGTYFPKESKWGKPGLLDLLPRVVELWNTEREKLISSSEEITRKLNDETKRRIDYMISENIFHSAFRSFLSSFDRIHGGFGHQPKFPMPHNISFLLRYYNKFKEVKALEMAELTLEIMTMGGICDHIGGGFHRYSTDEKWLVPHFEKMLYDQALLAIAYIEAYQLTKNEPFKITAQSILNYLLRDMTSPEGGFYTAEDADSEGVEGKFYLWKVDEIKRILGNDAENFIKTFNLTSGGNFNEPGNNLLTGENILHLKEKSNNKDYSALLEKLYNEREKREHPLKDDKVLTDWNGLAIAAFAKAFRVFQDDKYLISAENAAKFIFNRMLNPDGSLLHRYRDRDAAFSGNLDDYAFFAYGLIELFEASGNPVYLKTAVKLTDYMLLHFQDEKNGGFFLTSDNAEKLISRKKEIYDGAIPSGNSIALNNLLKISKFTDNENYRIAADKLVECFGGEISLHPSGYSQMLVSLMFLLAEPLEIVVVSDKASISLDETAKRLSKAFLPENIFIYKNPENEKDLAEICTFTESYKSINTQTTFYVCRNLSCDSPEQDVNAVLNKF